MTDLTQIRSRLNTSHKLGSIDSRDDDIATLLREVERLEADARRWRHVREHGPECMVETILGFPAFVGGVPNYYKNGVADEAVDQAIAASQSREVSSGNKP